MLQVLNQGVPKGNLFGGIKTYYVVSAANDVNQVGILVQDVEVVAHVA